MWEKFFIILMNLLIQLFSFHMISRINIKLSGKYVVQCFLYLTGYKVPKISFILMQIPNLPTFLFSTKTFPFLPFEYPTEPNFPLLYISPSHSLFSFPSHFLGSFMYPPLGKEFFTPLFKKGNIFSQKKVEPGEIFTILFNPIDVIDNLVSDKV